MSSSYTRRDFLKLASTLPLIPLVKALPNLAVSDLDQSSGLPNIIFILFDAFSALHLPIYGYPRSTTPNLEKFANRSTVYHAHRSAGNFTTPSTASLLTGTFPWTHRAFDLGSTTTRSIVPKNIFHLFEGLYHQVVFTQNIYADTILYQFEDDINRHFGPDSYSVYGNTFYNHFFGKDAIPALRSFDEFLFNREGARGSLFLTILRDLILLTQTQVYQAKYSDIHKDELPHAASTDVHFVLNKLMDGVIGLLAELPSPFFTYLHFLPPHAPYSPTREFSELFNDGWIPTPKKRHPLALRLPDERLNNLRRAYDQFIANLDHEFGRLFTFLEQEGLLENSYVIVTSDHGEFFERGVTGHVSPLLFEPIIRIPLFIMSPGQRERKDIYTPTSNVDILPTLCHIAGLPVPEWGEGKLLPGLGGVETPERSIFIVEAKRNAANKPLTKVSLGLVKGQYKITLYKGYKDYDDGYEFFDLKSDPEEMENIYSSHPMAKELQFELDQKLIEVNRPYISEA